VVKLVVGAIWVAAALSAGLPMRVAEAHDLHTTVLQISWDSTHAAVSGTLRVFADDLTAAARAARVTPADYVLRGLRFRVGGADANVILCGEQRMGDAVLICVHGTAQRSGNLRVANTLLLERYVDQVNIVRVSGGRSVTMLLTRGAFERTVP